MVYTRTRKFASEYAALHCCLRPLRNCRWLLARWENRVFRHRPSCFFHRRSLFGCANRGHTAARAPSAQCARACVCPSPFYVRPPRETSFPNAVNTGTLNAVGVERDSGALFSRLLSAAKLARASPSFSSLPIWRGMTRAHALLQRSQSSRPPIQAVSVSPPHFVHLVFLCRPPLFYFSFSRRCRHPSSRHLSGGSNPSATERACYFSGCPIS